jgi:hypothetical protein
MPKAIHRSSHDHEVSEGGAHPKTNVCSPVNSQFGAGRDWIVDRWIRWTTIACVGLLALIAGTVSFTCIGWWSRVGSLAGSPRSHRSRSMG